MEHVAPDDVVHADDNTVMMDVETGTEQAHMVQPEEAPPVVPPARQTTFPILDAVAMPKKPALRSVIYGPSIPEDPLVTIVPSLLQKVLNFISVSPSSNFLRNLSLIDINHNTMIPSFFNDSHILVHLVFLTHPQLGDHSLEKIALDYQDDNDEDVNEEVADEPTDEPEETDDDADLQVLDGPPAMFLTPRKKRALKVKEKLDDSLLRRSKRISNKLQGFKDAESAKKAKEHVASVNEPMPLAIIPGPAPHLSKEIIEGIATGFLHIQFESVLAALLGDENIDD